MNIMFNKKDINRFWDKVRKGNEDECWPYIGSISSNGYGQFFWKGKQYNAHIFAFMIVNDIILSGREIIIRHKCINNKICCNPSHLIDGSQKENIYDSLKYRDSRNCNIGKNNQNAKLTENEVRKIRQLGWHFTPKQIGNMPEYKEKISIDNIGKIIRYESWKHIK